MRDFKANETTSVDASKLLTALGVLTIQNKPSNGVEASIRRDGESHAQIVGNDNTLSLRPGRYYLSMQLYGQPAHQTLVTIAAGGKSIVNWDPGSEQPAAATPAIGRMVDLRWSRLRLAARYRWIHFP